MKAGMVSVEIKYHNFEVNSHQKQLERQTNSDQAIYQAAVSLFRELWNKEPIRLLGIRTSKLVQEGEPEQLSIFDITYESRDQKQQEQELLKKHEQLDKALDKIRRKYGEDAVKRGSFLKNGEQ